MKLLLVTGRSPWPPRRGDQLRALQMLDFLGAEHQVTLLAPATGRSSAPPEPPPFRFETYRAGPAGPALGLGRSLVSGAPLQSGLFYQPDLARRLRALAPDHDAVILQLARLALHRRDAGGVPVLVDLVDSLALSTRRRALVEPAWKRPLLNLEARRLARWERRLVASAQASLVVCDRDRQVILGGLSGPGSEAPAGSDPPSLEAIPLAFPWLTADRDPPAAGSGSPQVETSVPPGASSAESSSPRVLFTGNLGYFPNADAADWIVGQLWPRLVALRPEAELVLAGDRPPQVLHRKVKEAQKIGLRISLEARPADLRSLLAAGTVALAPLRAGAGQPLKILEAWAEGVPVLASPWAAAGLASRDAQRAVVTEPLGDRPGAREAEAWSRVLAALLGNASRRRGLVAAGRGALASAYGRDAIRRRLLTWIEAARTT